MPAQANPRLKSKPQALHVLPVLTFLPAEPGVAQDPILVVIKVDFPVGWEEGVGQLPRGAIEAVVGQGLQAVRVVDGIKTCGEKQHLEGFLCPWGSGETGKFSKSSQNASSNSWM